MKFVTLCLVLVVTAFGAVELSAQGSQTSRAHRPL